jgi:hypothetical protein
MADKPAGPLHLQRHMTDCTDALADALRKSVEHPVSIVCSLRCECDPAVLQRASRSNSSRRLDPRTIEARQRNIESSRIMRRPDGASSASSSADDRRAACRFFSLLLNDEEGVVHATCRRCERLILIYDRALYWGIKRTTGVSPTTYPYKCTCGGHTFEIAVGFEYPDEPIDENDINIITVAVRCAMCGEVAMIFDDEAT